MHALPVHREKLSDDKLERFVFAKLASRVDHHERIVDHQRDERHFNLARQLAESAFAQGLEHHIEGEHGEAEHLYLEHPYECICEALWTVVTAALFSVCATLICHATLRKSHLIIYKSSIVFKTNQLNHGKVLCR